MTAARVHRLARPPRLDYIQAPSSLPRSPSECTHSPNEFYHDLILRTPCCSPSLQFASTHSFLAISSSPLFLPFLPSLPPSSSLTHSSRYRRNQSACAALLRRAKYRHPTSQFSASSDSLNILSSFSCISISPTWSDHRIDVSVEESRTTIGLVNIASLRCHQCSEQPDPLHPPTVYNSHSQLLRVRRLMLGTIKLPFSKAASNSSIVIPGRSPCYS